MRGTSSRQLVVLSNPRFSISSELPAAQSRSTIKALNMSSQPHLQLFNSRQTAYDEELKSPLFSLLPKEIRLKIWRHALRRQRIIQLRLKSHRVQHVVPPTSEQWRGYHILVDGCQVLSKLLRVNRESREEALFFHRVHIRCRFTGGARREVLTGNGTL